jgi:hypothetical protein
MSLTTLALGTTEAVFRALCPIALAAGGSGGVSYLMGRYTRFSIGAPIDAVKFTAIAGIALIVFRKLTENRTEINTLELEDRRTGKKPSVGLEDRLKEKQIGVYASKFTLLGVFAYGLHQWCNPTKTLSSFAKLSVLSVVTLLSSGGLTASLSEKFLTRFLPSSSK